MLILWFTEKNKKSSSANPESLSLEQYPFKVTAPADYYEVFSGVATFYFDWSLRFKKIWTHLKIKAFLSCFNFDCVLVYLILAILFERYMNLYCIYVMDIAGNVDSSANFIDKL